MLWSVDPSSSTPLFEQVAACVRQGVTDGELPVGTRLPSAKDLAMALDVNMHTILRAYQELRDEGILELRKRRGAVVLASGEQLISAFVDRVIEEAAELGLTVAELTKRLEKR